VPETTYSPGIHTLGGLHPESSSCLNRLVTAIEIAREPYGSPVTRPLTDAQAKELVERYGGWEGAGSEPAPELFDDPDGYFLVARLNGSPVGCAGICRCEGEQTAELRRMYVAPEARRLGIARALMTALEEKARELGYQTLRLETGPEQPEAVRLYETSGFTVIPNFGPYSGQRRSICMEKTLL
jgi:GNAT superfamily N-acetyltransferase